MQIHDDTSARVTRLIQAEVRRLMRAGARLDLQDAVQVGWVIVLEAWMLWVPGKQPNLDSAWLRAVVRRRLLNEIRRATASKRYTKQAPLQLVNDADADDALSPAQIAVYKATSFDESALMFDALAWAQLKQRYARHMRKVRQFTTVIHKKPDGTRVKVQANPVKAARNSRQREWVKLKQFEHWCKLHKRRFDP